ncbi:MAG TPA: molybdopterin-synthase adenylyltransferase MoeB [Gemmatimonadales bacterium]|nr:molybdopterin-synthase adenylyltransferase MoeB [Gemmatimonadales bacterium]
MLSHEELLRYSRHLTLPQVGLDGQNKLRMARVLLIGAGGLGSPAALYLAAAGVGTLGIVDFDVVDRSNLQRQILHGTAGIGTAKTTSARERLHDVNPHVTVESFAERLTSANALEVIRGFDVVVDGSDNFPTRYLVNDACVLLGKPDVYGSVFQFDGQVSVFDATRGPCYRCLFADPPPSDLVPSCAEGGVLGVLPGVIGSLQALEAIKLILGFGESLVGRLLMFDGRRMQFRELALQKDSSCPVCGENATVTKLIDYEAFCGLRDAGSATPDRLEISAQDLYRERGRKPNLVLLDVREPREIEIAHIDGARYIPLRELPRRLAELPGHGEIVTICHHGQRSLKARDMLVGAGFNHVRSLAGGIDAWSREIDGNVPRY